MTLFKTIFVLITFVLFSCCSAKKTTSENGAVETSKNSEMSAKMIENGFKMGTIVASKAEGDCPFTIQMEGEDKPYFLDPINLDESFKKNGQKVWFTFNGLRMMNRCEKANPVSIVEMKKRED